MIMADNDDNKKSPEQGVTETDKQPEPNVEEPKSSGEEPKSSGEEPKPNVEEPKSSGEEPKTNGKPSGDMKPVQQQDLGEPNQLERKIIRQMEFYFGDRNLTKDKFLQEKIKDNPDGWVTLEVLLTFNRLKTLSTDPQVISLAIRKSTTGLLEVSEDGSSVRRINMSSDNLPSVGLLSPEVRQDMRGRTLYLKGFPEDTSLDDIQDFVLQFGETVLIQMRRFTTDHEKARQFKGSVFVEFKDISSVTKVTELGSLKFNDSELTVETKEQYMKRQNLKRKATNTAEDQSQSKVIKTEAASEGVIRQKEAVLHFNGCGADTTREQIKELFNQWSEVAWVDFNKGDTEGYIRFDEVGGAKKAFDALTKDGARICDGDTVIKVLEGEEEVEFWEKMKADQMKRRKQSGKRGGRGGRGGGRGGGRKRGRSRED